MTSLIRKLLASAQEDIEGLVIESIAIQLNVFQSKEGRNDRRERKVGKGKRNREGIEREGAGMERAGMARGQERRREGMRGGQKEK